MAKYRGRNSFEPKPGAGVARKVLTFRKLTFHSISELTGMCLPVVERRVLQVK